MGFILAHKFEIASILWIISELMAENKKIEANSVYQLVKGILKQFLGK